MSGIIPFVGGAMPAYAQRANDTPLMSAGMSGGGFNRIVLKMGVWRIEVGGEEVQQVQGKLPIVIHAFNPNISRQFYEGVYNPQDKPRPPECTSEDGVRPTGGSTKPQSFTCAQCPQNVKDINERKKCSTMKRLVVSVYGDPENRLFRLDIKGMSIFDKGQPQSNLFGFKDYAAKLDESRVMHSAFITNLVPDMGASVSKYFFEPVGYLPEDVFNAMRNAVDQETMKLYVGFGDGGAAQAQSASVPDAAVGDSSPVTPTVAPVQTPEPVVQAGAPVAAPVVEIMPLQVAPDVQPIAVQPVTIDVAAVEMQAVAPVAQPATTPTLQSAESLLASLGTS